MILGLDTSTPSTRLILITPSGKVIKDVQIETGNKLSEALLSLIEDILANRSLRFSDLTGLVIASGPGSFTGLRIGAATLNALAYALEIPIVGVDDSENWLNQGLERLSLKEDDSIVKLNYGAEPHITKQKK